MAKTFPCGSDWRKWDLHIHSPLSILANCYPLLEGEKPDWPSFLNRLESAELAVAGITDYFTIEGYKEIRRFQQEENKLKGITVFPNIEFRLNKVVQRNIGGAEKRLTLHVLFSNEVEPRDIEEHFLHDIDFVFEGEPQQAGRNLKLKVDNLQKLGERLKAENKGFTGSALQVGATTAIVDEEEICRCLANDPRFAGKYLVVLADENLSDMHWVGQAHVLRQSLLQRSDLVFSSNPKTIKWCLGKAPYMEGPDAFVREFKTLKPCIHGSDAHELDRIGFPCALRGEERHVCGPDGNCNLRNCWIKADPTFEGLRQIVYEPEDRIRIQADDPTPVRSGHSLSRFVASEARVNADLTIESIDLPLNHGLVAVAGGKGSGKTALLDMIAHSFSDRRFVENKNSFVKRIAGDKPIMSLSLTFANGNEFSKLMLDPAVYDAGEIMYIAQGELEDRIGNKEKLGAHIRELVLTSPQVKDAVRTFELRETESRATSTQKNLNELQQRIQSLENKTSEAIEAGLQKSGQMLQTNIADTDAMLVVLEKKVGEERTQKAKETQGKLQELENARDNLLLLRDAVDMVLTYSTSTLPTVIETINAINATITALNLDRILPVPPTYSTQEVTAVRISLEARLTETLASIEAASKELGNFEEEIQDHAGLLRTKAECEIKLAALKNERAELLTLREQLSDLRGQRQSLFRNMLQDTLNQRVIYRDLFEVFAANKQQVLSDVVFIPEVFYDKLGLESSITTLIDGRQVRDIPETLSNLHAAYRAVVDEETSDLETVVTAVEALVTLLGGKMKESRALDRATLYRVLWDNYLSVRPTLRYKNVPLDRLSLGQKATVLVKVYLAQGSTPIIIDSHDEHMDNEFIMNELVSALRQAKEYRQVIIASNNGNVVVNSDAEQVILASFSGGRISYTSGSLEEPEIREIALRVLEGGADAFRKRRAKYRVPT